MFAQYSRDTPRRTSPGTMVPCCTLVQILARLALLRTAKRGPRGICSSPATWTQRGMRSRPPSGLASGLAGAGALAVEVVGEGAGEHVDRALGSDPIEAVAALGGLVAEFEAALEALDLGAGVAELALGVVAPVDGATRLPAPWLGDLHLHAALDRERASVVLDVADERLLAVEPVDVVLEARELDLEVPGLAGAKRAFAAGRARELALHVVHAEHVAGRFGVVDLAEV